jgi:hypothetical protein
MPGLDAFGLEIVESVPLDGPDEASVKIAASVP